MVNLIFIWCKSSKVGHKTNGHPVTMLRLIAITLEQYWVTYSEVLAQRCSVKKVFLEISQNSQEITYARVSFLIKKETLAQVFSC